MIFIINSNIKFNTDDGTLELSITEDVLTLPLPARRLLELLLESNGEVLTRDHLFIEVWDKFGLTSSNSNLNQYLSLIRRSFSAYGCDDLIITLPKVGLKLSDNVTISKYHIDNSTNTNTNTFKVINQIRYNLKPITIVMIISLLTIFMLYLINLTKELDPIYNSYPQEEGCAFVLFKKPNASELNNIENQIKIIMKKNNLSCTKGKFIYFDHYRSFSTKSYGRTMLSYCNSSEDEKKMTCDNIYYLDWSSNEN